MSDKNLSRKELTKRNQRINKKRKNIRTLIILVLTAALVYATGIYGASLAFFGDFISSSFVLVEIGEGWPVEDDFSAVLQAESMGNSLCLLDQDSYMVYSPTAKQVQRYNHTMQNPVMDCSGNRTVIYDQNQSSLKVLNSHKMLFQQDMDSSIIHATISKSNKVAVTTRSLSYNGEVTVFNYKMEESFVWYCAKNFPVYSSLSDSGKTLAVTTVQTVDGSLNCEIYLIDATQGEEKFSISLQNYPLQLKFLNDESLLIAYPDKLVLWDITNNVQKAEYSFEGGRLLGVDYKNPYIAVSYGSYEQSQGNSVALLSDNLEEKFVDTIDEQLKSMVISQFRIFVLGKSNIYEYNYKGERVGVSAADNSSKKLIHFGGTILLGSNGMTKLEKAKK
ncbi:MAG: DUF5711 family protein [Oscillospiraceae bacterium]